MARDLTASMLAQVTAASLRPALFFEGEFAGPTYVRVWSGFGSKSWDSKTWTGVGHLGTVDFPDETTDLKESGFTVGLSGIPSSLLSSVLADARFGRDGKIWFAVLDSSGAVVADPYPICAGRMDVPEISEGAETSTIRISYESRMAGLKRPRIRRYTDEDQQKEFASDVGFEYIPGLQDWNGKWAL